MVMPGNALRLCRLRVANDSNPSLTTSVSKIISSTSSFVSFSLLVQHLLSPRRTHSDEHLQSVLQPPRASPLVCACSVHFCLHLSEASDCSLLINFSAISLFLLNTDFHVMRAGLLVLQRRSHHLRTLRVEVINSRARLLLSSSHKTTSCNIVAKSCFLSVWSTELSRFSALSPPLCGSLQRTDSSSGTSDTTA